MDLEQQQPLADQEEPYTLEDLPVTISTSEHSVRIEKAILQIGEEGFTILQELPEEKWLSISALFINTSGVGSEGTNLMIFVGDNQIEEEEEQPEIFKLIAASTAANLNLTGCSFTITLDLSELGKNVVKEVNDILVNAMGEANEKVSQYD